jgi:predicted amidohydrolase
MEDLAIALGLGLASGILLLGLLGTARAPLLAWVAVAPLCAAVYLAHPVVAGAAGFVAAGIAGGVGYRGMFPFARMLEVVIPLAAAIGWAIVSAVAAWVWPSDAPLACLLIWPAAMIGLTATISLPNAGRISSYLLTSQVGIPTVLHLSRLGNELVVPGLFGLAAAAIVIPFLVDASAPEVIAALAVAASVLAGAVAFGVLDARKRRAAIDRAPRVRVAAVASNPVVEAGEDYLTTGADDRKDIAGMIDTYGPLVEQAAGQGARLVVLPEIAAWVTESNRPTWIAALQDWTRAHSLWLVSGILELEEPVNRLVMVDPAGDVVASYDKQHPLGGGEPKRNAKMPPATVEGPEGELSAVLCYDLDYPDITRAVALHGGLLAVPSADWREIQELHHRAAIWGAVLSGATVVRANIGVSSIIDPAGRVLCRASSFDGPVVLVADAPILPPDRARWRMWNWPAVAAALVPVLFVLRML